MAVDTQTLFQIAQLMSGILNGPDGNIDEARLQQLTTFLAQKGDVDPSLFGKTIAEEQGGLIDKISPSSTVLPAPATTVAQAAAAQTPPFVADPKAEEKPDIGTILAQVGKSIQPAEVPTFTPPPALQVAAPPSIGQLGTGAGIDLQRLIEAITGGRTAQLPPSFGQQLLGV